MPKNRNLFRLEIFLLVISFLYYLFFVNKGLVFLDEGYFVHSAERIFNGQIPYKDFSLAYGPTYFYILAFLYKIFGPTILIGRFLSLSLCLFCIATVFFILNSLKIRSYLIITLSCLCLVSFGYPLINIPNIVWINVLSALLLVLTYIRWLSDRKNKPYILLFAMGILLALAITCKQNLGLIFVVLFTPLIIFGRQTSLSQTIKNLIVFHGTWIVLTFTCIYYFFLRNNPQSLLDFINYGMRFAQTTAFSYPPLTYLFQPLGIFKLLPYYLPIVLLFVICIFIIKKYREWGALAFSLVAVTGFFVSVFPQSDLLHVYPFLGMVLISFLLLPFKGKARLIIYFVLGIMILIGFYLTFFTKSYRYEDYYYRYDTYLNLPRTQGIMITKTDSDAILSLSHFIKGHTVKKGYIFVYPYSPILYFILERSNPSKDSLYFLPTWHFYSDREILAEIKHKNVKYIITDGQFDFGTDLSKFIAKQKKVFNAGRFQVFEAKY